MTLKKPMHYKEVITSHLKNWVNVALAINEYLTPYLDSMNKAYWLAVIKEVQIHQQRLNRNLNEVDHVNKTNLLENPTVQVNSTGSLEYVNPDGEKLPIDGVIPQTHHYYDSTIETEFYYFYGINEE